MIDNLFSLRIHACNRVREAVIDGRIWLSAEAHGIQPVDQMIEHRHHQAQSNPAPGREARERFRRYL